MKNIFRISRQNSNGILNGVWVFNADNSRFSGGVFTNLLKAQEWIKENKLSGILTLYPVNIGVYQWAIENGRFTPKVKNTIRLSLSADLLQQAKNITTMKMANVNKSVFSLNQ